MGIMLVCLKYKPGLKGLKPQMRPVSKELSKKR